MLFIVLVPEVWYQEVHIEAENTEDALLRVRQGEGDYLDDRLEYSHTLDEGWDSQEA